jgi:hypothetical protein
MDPDSFKRNEDYKFFMQSIDSKFSLASSPSIISVFFNRYRTVTWESDFIKSGANPEITFSGPEDVFPVKML